jgi:CheY-like chemotaxis protein
MTMPVMTGDTLAKAIRKIHPDLPVILCAGFTTKITKEQAEAMGIQNLLMKPFIKPPLAKAVRKALDGKD